MKKFICGLLGIAVLAGLLVSFVPQAGAAETLRFAIVPKCVHAWFDLVHMGARQEANKLSEVTGLKIEVEYRAPNAVDVTEQNTILSQVAATKPTGIALDPVDYEGSKAVIEEIRAQGITVVLFDAPAPEGSDLTGVGCNFTEQAVIASEYLVKHLNGKGKVAIMQGVPTAPNHIERYEAHKATLAKYPGIEVVAEGVDNDDIQVAQQQMAAIIAAHPDLDGVVCCNASGPIGIANAIKEAGMENKIFAVGMDGIKEILDAVKDGSLKASSASIPQKQGSLSVLAMFQAYLGLDMPKVIDTGINFATPENVDQMLKDLEELYKLIS
ncbi:ribose ABC transporter substrate-binding protein [Synergistales bacterium]|nr:ribose ABC transporter substrate-binding protein [Synergistales bacterium]